MQEAGPCPECKKEMLVLLMGEKICPQCAKSRFACARCFVAMGWSKDAGKGVKAHKGRIFITSSPENPNIVFFSVPNPKDATGAEIFVFNIKTKKTTQLTKNEFKDLRPRWR